MESGLNTALLEAYKAKAARDNKINSVGQYGKGNIDLYNRPQYRQPDGSVSTVRSMSFGDENGQEILVPTIANDDYGRPYQMTDRQAIDRYYDTGEYLGKFNSIHDANNYGDLLHQQQEQLYSNNTPYLDALISVLLARKGL